MITSIDIHGFKRFEQQSFELAPLTILAGLNGSGKTSFVQALLLASEASMVASGNSVRLNEPFGWELGTAKDVRNWTSDDFIEIRLRSEACVDAMWRFDSSSDEALYLSLLQKPDCPPAAFSAAPRAFSYLCAERLGPRSISRAAPLPAESLVVGTRGEHCAQILETLGLKPLEDVRRLHPTQPIGTTPLLKYQVELWLGEVSRPVEIDAVRYSGTAGTALRFRSAGGDWVGAPNMGFGVSYALPIILGGLTALPGGIIIVENPEAHLHPAGQSRMGVFLAWLAGRGVQVIVETHSDHVLNGIRRAIAEQDDFLNHDAAIVHFFGSGDDGRASVDCLEFTAVGGISHWPRGFFDQYQIDVASLGRIRRRG